MEHELESFRRGFSSRIAFFTMTRFAQARAHSLNTRFSLAQSSMPDYKAPFCLLVISRKEKRKLIEAIQILVKNLAEIPRESRTAFHRFHRFDCGSAQSFPHLSRAA